MKDIVNWIYNWNDSGPNRGVQNIKKEQAILKNKETDWKKNHMSRNEKYGP